MSPVLSLFFFNFPPFIPRMLFQCENTVWNRQVNMVKENQVTLSLILYIYLILSIILISSYGIMYLLQLIVDGLVLPDPHARHLLQHPLPVKSLQPINLQFRIPNVLQSFRRFIYLLNTNIQKMKTLCLLTLTGPALSSVHSLAVSLMTRRGSIQETAKYIEIIIDLNIFLKNLLVL